ncbi:hypothetical protein N5C79_20250 [Pantoea brenneri]|uniref:hypothetical protein n=1 Tax=Pantoea brenneri TaxID=472694 RepID=UPI00244C97B7|nr:hypothetical protein [Pantoea brenneri]MDH1088837.1 hypothetical protein [Pantoea brenneri]
MAPRTHKPAADNAAQSDAASSPETNVPEAGQAPEIAANGESGADSAVAALTPSEDPESTDLAETVEVVVRAKRTVRHEGETHGATTVVTLPREEAERLKEMGFVDYLDELRETAQASQGVKVTVSGGVALKQE